MYGIWNDVKKEFQFGISEPTKRQAMKALFSKIGKNAYKWRFEARKLPVECPKCEGHGCKMCKGTGKVHENTASNWRQQKRGNSTVTAHFLDDFELTMLTVKVDGRREKADDGFGPARTHRVLDELESAIVTIRIEREVTQILHTTLERIREMDLEELGYEVEDLIESAFLQVEEVRKRGATEGKVQAGAGESGAGGSEGSNRND